MKKQQKQNLHQQKTNKVYSKINNVFIFLFLLSLPTQLGKHFFPNFSYLSGVRIDYLAPTLYFTDIIFSILFLLNIKTIIKSLWNKKFLIFIFLLSINVLFALSQPIAVYKSLKILEVIFIFWLLRKKQLSTSFLLTAFSIPAGIELLLAILQMKLQHSLQGIFYFLGERYFTLSTPDIAKASLNGTEILRPYGTFSHPNSLGGFYLLLYFFVLIDKRFEKNIRFQYFFLLLSGLLVFFSFSKVVILLFLLINILYLVRNPLHCKLCTIARIILFSVLAIIFSLAQGDKFTVIKRWELVQNATTIFFQHILFGTGIGNYLVAQNQFPIKYPYFFLQPVHNIFFLFLCEAGIILFVFAAKILFDYAKNYKTSFPFYYLLAIVCITGFFDHYWLTLQQNILLLPVIFALL